MSIDVWFMYWECAMGSILHMYRSKRRSTDAVKLGYVSHLWFHQNPASLQKIMLTFFILCHDYILHCCHVLTFAIVLSFLKHLNVFLTSWLVGGTRTLCKINAFEGNVKEMFLLVNCNDESEVGNILVFW
jgi:hypothetical protein